jgi:hypothetical protein
VAIKTHDGSPVPYAMCGKGIAPGSAHAYSEKAAAGSPLVTAVDLFESFIKGRV